MASVCMSVRPRPPWMHMLAGATAIGGPSGVVSHSRPQAHARIDTSARMYAGRGRVVYMCMRELVMTSHM